MNLRRKTPPDSLYLLLDTLCNAFGGIILLAVLVVLLTTKEKSQHAPTEESSAALRHRLAIAKANLEDSRKLAGSLEAKAGDASWRQQMTLLSSRKELQDSLQQLRDADSVNSKDLETASAADPAERLKFLNTETEKMRVLQVAAKNDLAVAKSDNETLDKRKTATDKRVVVKFAELQQPLRLPIEHNPGKRAIYVIIRYGRIYPCKNIDSSENDADIKWSIDDQGQAAEPIPDRGYTPGTFGNYLDQLSGDEVYVVYCVFADSFTTFIQARQATVTAGVIYGWVPFRIEDDPVRFSVAGHTPGAQ